MIIIYSLYSVKIRALDQTVKHKFQIKLKTRFLLYDLIIKNYLTLDAHYY